MILCDLMGVILTSAIAWRKSESNKKMEGKEVSSTPKGVDMETISRGRNNIEIAIFAKKKEQDIFNKSFKIQYTYIIIQNYESL